ncbi:hypothetical protein JMJ77_0005754 [Colletotrichum scovillei]|uniref:Uncharacterized protein n=1 Tax=Colletotrichum scovillei TaxID=1209932 RepID=A0A9P7UJ11_9PEZI|nr:hypothetical protein JMJ77_0005754 [Colletotrichum scovillei]KAG7076957.1 hypothetical protein JMJ76_0014213 [Colletotrichum scovillei]KAG7084096.1 hypothetical protein JMJ78_0009536 [Colletotrichum scovillei]
MIAGSTGLKAAQDEEMETNGEGVRQEDFRYDGVGCPTVHKREGSAGLLGKLGAVDSHELAQMTADVGRLSETRLFEASPTPIARDRRANKPTGGSGWLKFGRVWSIWELKRTNPSSSLDFGQDRRSGGRSAEPPPGPGYVIFVCAEQRARTYYVISLQILHRSQAKPT